MSAREGARRGVNSRCCSFASQGGREKGGPLLFTSASSDGDAAPLACSKEIVFHPSRNGGEGGREGAVMSSSPLIATVVAVVVAASAVAVI